MHDVAKFEQDDSTVAKFGVPLYKLVHYETLEEMESYISGPDYKTSRKKKGVCVGLQHYVDDDTKPNNYTFSWHYPDKRLGLSKLGYS
jgi:hypothetical protein